MRRKGHQGKCLFTLHQKQAPLEVRPFKTAQNLAYDPLKQEHRMKCHHELYYYVLGKTWDYTTMENQTRAH